MPKQIRVYHRCEKCGQKILVIYSVETKQVAACALEYAKDVLQFIPSELTECTYQEVFDVSVDISSGKMFISDWLRIEDSELSTILGLDRYESELNKGYIATQLLYKKYSKYDILSVHGYFPEVYTDINNHALVFGPFNEQFETKMLTLPSDGYRNLLITDVDNIKKLIEMYIEHKKESNSESQLDVTTIFNRFLDKHKQNIISVQKGKYQGKHVVNKLINEQGLSISTYLDLA